MGLILLIVCIAVAIFAYRDGNDVENQSGKLGLCVASLFPIIGVIMYFIQRDKVTDANKYFKWAAIGFGLGLICNIILLSM